MHKRRIDPTVSGQELEKSESETIWSMRRACISPKFQQGKMGISIVTNDLWQFPVPVSGYIVINRSASACSASASVTWRNVVWLGSLVTTHVFRQRVPR